MGHYLPFNSPSSPKNQSFQKIKTKQNKKKTLEISSFYIFVPNIMIRRCTVREKWCATNGQIDRRTNRRTDGQKKWRIEVGNPLKNKENQSSPLLIKNTKEISICQSHPFPFLADIISKQFLKLMRIYYKYVKVE